MGLDNSVAPSSEIDSDEQSVWGLNPAEANNDSDAKRLKEHIIYAILKFAVENRGQLLGFLHNRSDSDRICTEKAFRNLINAWRDEYCLNNPVDTGPEERMKTAEWRITMCYYALYKSTSAIIRTKDGSDLSSSHRATLRKHSNQLMSSRARGLHGYPFNLAPSSGQFFDFRKPSPYFISVENEGWISEIRGQHEEKYINHYGRQMNAVYSKAKNISTQDNGWDTFTLYHVFKLLRGWTNYGHGGILSRLYGPDYTKLTDRAIRLSVYSTISAVGIALVRAFGIDKFERELRYYQESYEEGVSEDAIHAADRYKTYQRALSDF